MMRKAGICRREAAGCRLLMYPLTQERSFRSAVPFAAEREQIF